MGMIVKREGKLGNTYRAVVRRPNQKPVTKTFKKKAQASSWVSKTEDLITEGLYREDRQNLGLLIDRYTKEIGAIKPFGRSKTHVLSFLRGELGHLSLNELTADRLMAFALQRFKTCTACTVKNDMQYLGGVLSTAENMWGAKPNILEYKKCMSNCARLQVIAASDERDRRATDDEIEEILSQVRSTQPVAEWLYFSIATAMRVGEVGALRWSDLSKDGMSIIIRQRKHPRKKRDEVVPLVPEARNIIARQPRCLKNPDLIFPHKHRSITSAFRSARDRTGIKDLRWHDLRHEAISRLFEMGFDSMVVAKFSGHRDINMLRRYTHIDAAKVLKMLEERQAALNL